ncbi:ankyrin-1-like [Uloborus diversus]|uniref:ankyrin-1-like n=1 Tax=Uloborus diversus TaxID=327109 RepID=UPI00240A99C3|nr:ankyrin-1-like [Uloborus diversus]
MVKELLSAGANVLLPTNLGWTPLHFALQNGAEDVAEVFLESDRVIDMQDKWNRTPLHVAVERRCTGTVRKLLALGANTRIQGIDDRTPLHIALREEMEDMAEILVNFDSENKLKDIWGLTPLHLAARAGYVRIMRKLLAAGADFRSQDREGNSPLHIALRSDKEEIANLLVDLHSLNDLRNSGDHTPLHFAAEAGMVGVMKKLIAAGADIHAQSCIGYAPLHFALVYEWEDAANLLVDLESKNEPKNDDGDTPLHTAAEAGMVSIVKKLLAAGADIYVQNKYNEMPLHLALYKKKEETANLLLDLMIANNFQGCDENSLLWVAVCVQSVDVVRKLLFSNVHPHRKHEFDEKYPLFIAFELGRNDIAKMLLSSCALKHIAIHGDDSLPAAHDMQYCVQQLAEFEAEIHQMKNTKLYDTTISYYDLASASVAKLALYYGNENVRSVLLQDELQKFPNYAELIYFRMRKAETRKVWHDKCMECFAVLCHNLPPLSAISIDNVLLSLSEKEMQILVEAFNFNL